MSDKAKIIAGIAVIAILAIYHLFIENNDKERDVYQEYLYDVWDNNPEDYINMLEEADKCDPYIEDCYD